MGCVPSSTYPEHIPRSHVGPTQITTAPTGHRGSDCVYSRAASTALVQSGGGADAGAASKHGATPLIGSPGPAPPLLRVERKGDVGADGVGLASTAYTTSTGRIYRFLHGRPVGFAGAEEVISCLDDGGMHGNLYRLVRSKLLSIGEEEAHAVATGGGAASSQHADTLSASEALERERGVEVFACSVTARRRQQDLTPEAALQERYVVALLGTDTIADASAIPASRFRSRPATVRANGEDRPATAAGGTALHLSATLEPLTCSSSSSAATSPSHAAAAVQTTTAAAGGKAADAGEVSQLAFAWEDDMDYKLHPQAHYSALPAQRKAGAAVPLALCPPSRSLRVPVEYSAVEDRLVTTAGGSAATAGDKEKGWRAKVLPQRMFRLATSETRTWAFYNDSESAMHVFTLFDRASKLEPRDSTRLWPNSVFDDGNVAPTPPPLFFGLFFDEDGEEAVAASEMPDSVAQRQQQRIFGTRGMWIAELLVPPRSTRLFVEGKVRGAYRMRCTQLALDDLVAVTDMAQLVARKRNARHVADRFRFGLRRPIRNSGSVRPPAAGSANPLVGAAGAAAATTTDAVETSGRLTSSPVRVRNSDTPPPQLERSLRENGCHSTLTESQGVLTRQTFIRHLSAHPPNDAATAAAAVSSAPLLPVSSVTARKCRVPSAPAASEAVVREVVHQPMPQSAAPPPCTAAEAALALSIHSVKEGAAVAAAGSSGVFGVTTAEQAGTAAIQLPPPAASAEVSQKRDEEAAEEGEELGSASDTHGSCAEFARVRPDRQRHIAAHGDSSNDNGDEAAAALLVGPAAPFHYDDSAAVRGAEPGGVAPLAQATMPEFLADSTTAAAAAAAAAPPLDESAGRRLGATRKPRASPGAPESLVSPRLHRRRLSSVPHPSGGLPGVSVEGEEATAAAEAADATAALWHAKMHTLTPQSSYQSERLRRAGMPSISSCRTIAVDDWAESMDVEADVPVHESAISASGGRTVPHRREAVQADPSDE